MGPGKEVRLLQIGGPVSLHPGADASHINPEPQGSEARKP